MGDKVINWLEIKRQLLHVFTGILVLFLIVVKVLSPLSLFLIIVISVILSIMSKRFRVPVVQWFLDNFERDADKESFPGRGFISFFVGVLLAVKLFEPSIAYASIMVLTLGDTVSHLVGTHIGRIRHPLNSHKSLEGNIAGGFTGFVGAMFFVEPLLAAIGAFGAMTVEAIQIRMNNAIIDDNIIVPLACGVIIMLAKAYLMV